MAAATAAAVLAAALMLATLPTIRANTAIMTDVTLGFGEALEHCRDESGLTTDKMEEFFHFWHEDFKFEDRELGCALRCMSKYFNIITDTNRMHHQNTEKFILGFPNGELLAKQLIEMIHECEKVYDHEEDDCWRFLHIAECFKKSCKNQSLAPTMEMLMAEFIMQAE